MTCSLVSGPGPSHIAHRPIGSGSTRMATRYLVIRPQLQSDYRVLGRKWATCRERGWTGSEDREKLGSLLLRVRWLCARTLDTAVIVAPSAVVLRQSECD